MGFTLRTALEKFVPGKPWNEEGDSSPLTIFYKAPDFGLMSKFIPKTKIDVNNPEAMNTEIELDLSARVFDAIMYCVKRIDNLFDGEGKPIELPKDVNKREKFISSLPSDLAFAIGNHILSNLSSTGEDSEKKE